MIAVTATVNACTRKDIIRKLDMNGCTFIYESPDRPNIYYGVKLRTNLDTDLANVVDDLKTNSVKALRVIIYCKSLNMCADLYAHFLYELGSMSYYPPGAEETASNRPYLRISLICLPLTTHLSTIYAHNNLNYYTILLYHTTIS